MNIAHLLFKHKKYFVACLYRVYIYEKPKRLRADYNKKEKQYSFPYLSGLTFTLKTCLARGWRYAIFKQNIKILFLTRRY